jgi:ABC-type bacteriocin/lantibiotic exporter with double-glycine peptidase domain
MKNLSGGEKQVIAILRALCSEKPILLMNEPFAAMNQITIDTFMEHLDEIQKTVLIIAHNIDQYADVFDEQMWVKR